MSRFQRIRSQRLYEQIVQQVQELVRTGQLSPGGQLPSERELSEQLGVSRAAVREALSAMELMGLLEVRPGEGTFIRKIDHEALIRPLAMVLAVAHDETLGREILEVRKALEAESAALAALRAEPDDVEAIAQALREMEANLQVGATGDEADWNFHLAVARGAGNGLLLRLMLTLSDILRESVRDYRRQLARIPGRIEQILEEHRAVYEAIRNRDPEAARRNMLAHLAGVETTLFAPPARRQEPPPAS